MSSPRELTIDAAKTLADCYASFTNEESSPQAKEFQALRLQMAMFNFDVCRELFALGELPLSEFPLHTAAKDLALKLYEFDATLSGQLVARVAELAMHRGVAVHSGDFKIERRRWKSELKKISGWRDVRNSSAGHYDGNIARQVDLLSMLNPNEVLLVAAASLQYTHYFLDVLAKVGRGHADA